MSTALNRRLRDLLDAAGELTAAGDEDAVLHTVIRQARRLIGTDLAYLMLLDREAGDTYMRVAEGAISPRFDTIRLGMGLGLGGQVAESMSPRWTRDYLADEQYTHVIDPIILEEGLHAILGVPVKKHGRLTGILFTSERSVRDFTQDDITVLALLADHASLAIDAAARSDQQAAELARARARLAAQEHRATELGAAIDLHERLTRLVVDGAAVPEILDLLVDLAGGTAAVFDTAGREIGSARSGNSGPAHAASPAHTSGPGATPGPGPGSSTPGGPDPSVLQRALEDAPAELSATATVGAEGDGGVVVVVTPVVTGSDTLGVLAMAGHSPAPDLHHVLERAASVIALILLGQRARDEADNRVRGELLAEILAPGATDLDSLGRRAALLGVDVDAALVAVVVTPVDGTVSRTLQSECSLLARQDGGLVTAYGDRVVLLTPASDAGEAARSVADRLAPAAVTVGASGPMTRLTGVEEHVERARRAARLLSALGRDGEGAATEELGVYGLLFSEVDRDYVRGFVERLVGPVRDYDRDRGTTLLQTLRTWFEAEGSASGTANRMFVHVNTVYQRLDRLDQVLGEGWRSGDRALEVRLALRLYELMSA